MAAHHAIVAADDQAVGGILAAYGIRQFLDDQPFLFARVCWVVTEVPAPVVDGDAVVCEQRINMGGFGIMVAPVWVGQSSDRWAGWP